MLDYCQITAQIAKNPSEDIKKWGILTVRDFLGYEAHMLVCSSCQILMDAVLAEHKDEPQRPDLTNLN